MSRSHRRGACHRRSHNTDGDMVVAMVMLGLLIVFVAGWVLAMSNG